MLGMAARIARREFRARMTGIYIFLACIALGTAAIGSVTSVSQGMMDSLNADGRLLLGGDISLRSVWRPLSPEQTAYIEKNFGRTSHMAESNVMARRADGAQAAMIEVKAVDAAYPLYGELQLADGTTRPPQAGEAFADAEVLTRLNVQTGDTIMIGDAAFVIRTLITREPDRISGTHYSIAPRVMIALPDFARTGLDSGGSRLDFKTRIATPEARTPEDLDKIEKQINAQFPDEKWRIRNFYNASPQIERLIDRLTVFLSLAGLTTLLVGGVGVYNSVRSFLDSKISHIATLKCLGAPRSLVFSAYFIQILRLALLGIALGTCLTVFITQAAGTILTAQMGIGNHVSAYPLALAVAGIFSLLITVCFSILPLDRAMRVSPADLFRDDISPVKIRPSPQALIALIIAATALIGLATGTSYMPMLSFYFCIAALLSFGLFLLCARGIQKSLGAMRPAWPELRMAAANIRRPGNAAGAIILSLGLGLTVLITMAQIEHNFSRLLKDNMSAKVPSFFFIDIQPSQTEAFEDLLEGMSLEITPSLRGRITAINGIPAEKALVDKNEEWLIRGDRNFTYSATPPPHGNLTRGAWWPADYQGPPLVAIVDDVARGFDIKPGDQMTFNILGMDITATVAAVREVEWTSFTMNFAVTFAPGTLEAAPASAIATAIVDKEQELPLQAKIASEFPNITSVRVRDALTAAQDVVRTIGTAIRASAAVTLVAGILVLAGGIAASRRCHIYDAVVLKVLGATRGRILSVFLLEYALLGFVAAVIAAVIGTLGSYAIMRKILDLPWAFSPTAVAAVTVFCLIITLAAGFLGTWRALAQRPAAALRNL